MMTIIESLFHLFTQDDGSQYVAAGPSDAARRPWGNGADDMLGQPTDGCYFRQWRPGSHFMPERCRHLHKLIGRYSNALHSFATPRPPT